MSAPTAAPIEVAGFEIWGEPQQNIRCLACGQAWWVKKHDRTQEGFEEWATDHRIEWHRR